jgi:hypothetical protein
MINFDETIDQHRDRAGLLRHAGRDYRHGQAQRIAQEGT